MLRRLISLIVLACCLISLAACLAAAWFWSRSYHTIDRVVWDRSGRHGQLSSAGGRLSLIVLPDHSTGPAPPSWQSVPLASVEQGPLGPQDNWTEGAKRFWVSNEHPDRQIGPVRITGGQLAITDYWPARLVSRAPVTARVPPAKSPPAAISPPAAQAPPTSANAARPPAPGSAGRTAGATAPLTTTGPASAAVPASSVVTSGGKGNAPPLLPGAFARDDSAAPSDFKSDTAKLYSDEFKLFRELPKEPERVPGGSFAGTTPRAGSGSGPAVGVGYSGYSFLSLRMTPRYVFNRWTVPYWSLVCAAALAPLLWSGVHARRVVVRWRRARRGLCLACGYDLAHNVSGVCSECGMRVEKVE